MLFLGRRCVCLLLLSERRGIDEGLVFCSKWMKMRRGRALVFGELYAYMHLYFLSVSQQLHYYRQLTYHISILLIVNRQIACADVILLNKTDISLDIESREEERLGRLERLEKRIRAVNPSAPIYRTVKGEVDLGLVIGIEAYSAKLDLGIRTGTGTGIGIGAGPSGKGEHSHNHGGEHGDGCGNCEHEHKRGTSHDGVSSIQVACPPLSASRAQKLDEWIRAALWEGEILGGGEGGGEEGKVEVLRCKGVYSMESGERYVLQGVRNLYEITRVEEGGEVVGVPEEGKLVFIGKGVGEEARRSLEKMLRD